MMITAHANSCKPATLRDLGAIVTIVIANHYGMLTSSMPLSKECMITNQCNIQIIPMG